MDSSSKTVSIINKRCSTTIGTAPPAIRRAVLPPQRAACNLREALPGVYQPPTLPPVGIQPVFTSMMAQPNELARRLLENPRMATLGVREVFQCGLRGYPYLKE
ncbi:hypothetical protein EV421DRAFT_1911121 [Armillaria borealis]|uniref:Uncharacterized protein n=1 Tax=Armillaria borealis TaxID=47425 RepID=A0AA39IXD8_9AGAR|nr:hypothetical protein EV421DRAFT_1911121 [Armillaria borealis]